MTEGNEAGLVDVACELSEGSLHTEKVAEDGCRKLQSLFGTVQPGCRRH